MHKLVILRGNSGSGKSSVARALQQKFGSNTMLLSHDMIRMEILHVWGVVGVEKSLPLMIQLLKYGWVNSEVTILEGILDSVQYRKLFDAAQNCYGEHIHAYYYDLPFEETLRRHATKPNCHDFGEPEMRRWWREKDFLPMIRETVLDQTVGFEQAVERIYCEVRDDTGHSEQS